MSIPTPRRAARLMIIWLPIVLLMGVIAGVLLITHNSVTTLKHAELRALARLIEQHASSTIDRANLVLIAAGAQVKSSDLQSTTPLPDSRRGELVRTLAQAQATSHGVVSISLTDADGTVLANSLGAAPGQSLGDRKYFLALKEHPEQAVSISEAVKGRVSNKWGIQVARRVTLPDGRFGGMLVANLGLPENFEAFYESLQLGDGATVSLRNADNRILVRYPVVVERLGTPAALSSSKELIRANVDEAIFDSRSGIDNIDRVLAMRRLPAYPIYVFVGLPKNAIYLAWWRYCMLAAVTALAMVLAGAIVHRLRNQEDALLAARARDDAALRLAYANVKELNDTLENRVAQRTAEREAALKHLHDAQELLAASEARATLSTLVASVSHELNSPIGNSLLTAESLVVMAQELERLVQADRLGRANLSTFLASVKDGTGLMLRNLQRAEELLGSFKQVAADQASEQRRAFNLASMMHEIIETLTPSLRCQPHRVEVDIPPDIVMDSLPGALGQIVINLINNAYLHAFEHKAQGLLKISATANPSAVSLRFADDGSGIAPENLAHLFDPFFSTKINKGGTGLGLAIVKNLATKQLGGNVEVASVLGSGTQFILNLPLVAPAAAPVANGSPSKQP
jgi:signal transduction histidine kinase